jgi:hypothetical protein
MQRSELAITILGLLGTFLLPWPGGDGTRTAGATDGAAIVAARRCVQPVRTGAAPERHDRACARERGRGGCAAVDRT